MFVGADTKSEFISGDRTREMLMGPSKGKIFTDFIWQDSQINRFGIFSDSYYQIGKNTLALAARIDNVAGKAKKPAETFLKNYSNINQTDINISASIGVSSRWTEKLSSGLWVGRGVRSANISERFINFLAIGKDPYEMLGNPELLPEKNNQLDANLSYKSTKSEVQLSVYYSIVNDFISSAIDTKLKPLLTAPGVRRYINIDKANLYGLEVIWNQNWSNFINQMMSLSYNYGQNISEKIPLPEISPMNFRYQIDGNFLSNRISPFVSFRYSFKQDKIAVNYGEAKTDDFKVFDFGIKSQIFKGLQTSLTLTNAFNENYREHLSRFISAGNPLYTQGRSFVANLTYSF
jgi:iron complex outermembrane receptor protein